jgi:hypothetical protein
MRGLLLTSAILLAAQVARGEERPSEEELFGKPTETQSTVDSPQPTVDKKPDAAAEAKPALDEAGRPSEDALFGGKTEPAPAAPARELVPDDPLKIGGKFYLRGMTMMSDEAPASKWGFSAPMLVDGYLDARPNERVRGFLLARLAYDPTIAETPPSSTPVSLSPGKQLSINLDQLWVSFDVSRAVFVTAGRQHVKWGPAHFWNPTDFLHQMRRDPLAPFDTRVGTTMVKVQVPWEKLGWNLYAIGLLEDTVPDGTLGKVGGALRAEVVVGPAEIGAEAIFQRGHKPRLGADVSAGVGPFDVYAEASLRRGWELPLFRFAEGTSPTDGVVEQWQPDGYVVQATGGISWSLNYRDVNLLTFGAEYFFNSIGYDDLRLYPWLLAQNAYTPFYLGKHYAGLYGMLTAPATWHNLTLVLSDLANFSDRTFITRVDASVLVLTHLRVEAYVAFHYGHKGGEFRFAMDLPATDTSPAFSVPTQLAELGVGLRIDI